jgi:DnaJ like chaperone protein
MSFWGKILGSMAGFAMGGPLGAMVGAAVGHAADQGALPGQGRIPPNAADMVQMLGGRENLFSFAVVVLAAKLAKVDGPVKRAEIDAFRQMFRVPEEALRDVGRLFDQARETSEDWEPFAERLGEAFSDNKAMLEDVLAALVRIARADGPVTRTEGDMLRGIHARFGLDAAAWQRAKGGAPRGMSAQDIEDPYPVLGLTRDASDEQIRAAWKQLMRENHPDTLSARGVPEEFVKRATTKVAEINAAWDRIKRERGL